jgi:hypothetical protein
MAFPASSKTVLFGEIWRIGVTLTRLNELNSDRLVAHERAAAPS